MTDVTSGLHEVSLIRMTNVTQLPAMVGSLTSAFVQGFAEGLKLLLVHNSCLGVAVPQSSPSLLQPCDLQGKNS